MHSGMQEKPVKQHRLCSIMVIKVGQQDPGFQLINKIEQPININFKLNSNDFLFFAIIYKYEKFVKNVYYLKDENINFDKKFIILFSVF